MKSDLKRYYVHNLETDKLNIFTGGKADWLSIPEADRDRIEFYQHCLASCGAVVFSRETLKGKTAVKIRGLWQQIVRLNPTTVAVPNICYPQEEHQRKYALKYAYTEVQDAR